MQPRPGVLFTVFFPLLLIVWDFGFKYTDILYSISLSAPLGLSLSASHAILGISFFLKKKN